MLPLFDLTYDCTLPLCMNGIIISGMLVSGFMLTPMILSTLGWSNLLAVMHSSINSFTEDNEISTDTEQQKILYINNYYAYTALTKKYFSANLAALCTLIHCFVCIKHR